MKQLITMGLDDLEEGVKLLLKEKGLTTDGVAIDFQPLFTDVKQVYVTLPDTATSTGGTTDENSG